MAQIVLISEAGTGLNFFEKKKKIADPLVQKVPTPWSKKYRLLGPKTARELTEKWSRVGGKSSTGPSGKSGPVLAGKMVLRCASSRNGFRFQGGSEREPKLAP